MKSKGFTLIELLIAMGLSALFLPALVFVFSFSLGAASQGESYTQAYALAQENMEAIYYLKENSAEWNWQTQPANTTSTNEYYQPYKAAGTWNLGLITSSPQQINGYTVTVKILPVIRNMTTGDISDSGEVDIYTREVIVNVSWKEKGEPTDIELVSYVSRH
jgi:prepilin-type N-terminal cleavage/methylation domain-containing protein